MKKNLLFAGIIYAVSVIPLMIYLSVVASEDSDEIIGILSVAGTTFLCFALGFLSYLIYFLRQTKVLEDEAYTGYLGIGIRLQWAFLVSAILGAILSLILLIFMSDYYELTYIANWWEIAIPVIVLVAVNMVCFIALKPRP